MKSSFDMKHGIGKITPENMEDVYLLSSIITNGALLTARTIRSREIRRGDETVKGKKESIVLTISVEKTEFQDEKCLRVGGKIVKGPEDLEHGYHSIEIAPNDFITVEKSWRSWEIDKIKKAEKKAEKVLVCVLDETEADIWLVQERAKHLVHFACSLGKKSGISTKPQYYSAIYEYLKGKEELKYARKAELSGMPKSEDFVHFVVAGPAFAKEELSDFVRQKYRKLAEKISIHPISQTGEAGLQELLKSGILEKLLKQSRISEETEAVEKLLSEIGKDGLAVYGLKETQKALEAGAIETLLVSDKKVREIEDLLERAEKQKAKILIVSSEHQSGEKLLGLGGVAGLLKYKVK
ncbi:mRNA surveillance protein pelota [archaeon]|nr:MAG: mRNA surveillance protein pelota [archaeon]